MTPTDILDFVTRYGPLAPFIILWWLERGERIDAQAELKQVAKDSIVAMIKVDAALVQLISVFKPGQSK